MPFSNLFIDYLRTDPAYFFAVCISVVFSICIHELAHGIAAIRLGDRTPIETGHMTLNPMVHMGGMSLILLLTAGIAWGRMPINPSRLRGRHARAIVALAGPASNIVMGILALGALGLMIRASHEAPVPGTMDLASILWIFGAMNFALAIFNLIPIPPLDGSNVLADFSQGYAEMMMKLRQGGQSTIIFLVIFMFAGNFIVPAASRLSIAFLRWVVAS
jgi:Zn-dependent protease